MRLLLLLLLFPLVCLGQTITRDSGTGAQVEVTSTSNAMDVNVKSGGGTITPTRGTLTDRSGAVTLGGTSQTLAAANTSRNFLLVQNPCTATLQNIATAESLFVSFTSAASTTAATSFELVPCASLQFTVPNWMTTEAITVNAATTNHRWTAKEN